jgi:hypothetical protein
MRRGLVVVVRARVRRTAALLALACTASAGSPISPAARADEAVLERLRDTAALLSQQRIDQLQREQRLDRLRFEQQIAGIEERARRDRHGGAAAGHRAPAVQRETAELRLREGQERMRREESLEQLRRRERAARLGDAPGSREEELRRFRLDQQLEELARESRAQAERYERLGLIEERGN